MNPILKVLYHQKPFQANVEKFNIKNIVLYYKIICSSYFYRSYLSQYSTKTYHICAAVSQSHNVWTRVLNISWS